MKRPKNIHRGLSGSVCLTALWLVNFTTPGALIRPLIAGQLSAGEQPVEVQSQTQTPEHHARHTTADRQTRDKTQAVVGSMDIPDVLLFDQDGRKVRFYTDLIENKTVAINAIFTTCTTICPPMGVNFARLQDVFADRIGKEIHLISLSVDPVVDTPERLKAWAGMFGAKQGWTLLTGPKATMDKLLKALKFFTPDKQDHSPMVLVGNDSRGEWRRAYGLAPPKKLADAINAILEGSRP